MIKLVDADQRARAADKLGESQVVEAAAGTGKTRVLVDRMLRVLSSGLGQLSQMVVE